MKYTIKDITNHIHTTFKEDGVFDNEFLDESKFKARLYKLLSTSNVMNYPLIEMATKAIDIAHMLTNEIVAENVDTTLGSLVSKGIIKEVPTNDGVGYIMDNK